MKAHVVVFAIVTALTTAAAAAADGNGMDATQSAAARKWWRPDPNSYQFQIQKDNQVLKEQGFDPYSP